MRAAYYEAFGGPENLQVGERPDPVPDAGQMLVRTHAAGVGIWDVGMMRGGRGQASLPIAKLASSGKLRMPIGAEFPLERAGEAMEHVSARHTVGRVVLRIGS